MAMGIIVYLSRTAITKIYWADVMESIWEVFRKRNWPFRYMLVDVGLSRLLKYYGTITYPQWFVDMYVSICEGLYESTEGRVIAIIPDFPAKWDGKWIDNYFEKHYKMLKEWEGHKSPVWVPIFRYEYLSFEQIDFVLNEFAPLFDCREIIAIAAPAIKENIPKFLYALRGIRRVFPKAKIHLLALRSTKLKDIRVEGIRSVDLGKAAVSYRLLKSYVLRRTVHQDVSTRHVENIRLSIKDAKTLYMLNVERVIKEVESLLGEVDYGGWVEG